MTDILRDARSKMQSKAERFIAGDKPGKLDCSDYTPEALDVESNEKNSGQPNNPRMRYKRGGTVGKSVGVEGDKPKVNAGRKPRAKGGKTEWSPEAEHAGSSNRYGPTTPVKGLANRMQEQGAHNPDGGQWAAMMSALPRNGRQKAQSVYGGRKVTTERDGYASGGTPKLGEPAYGEYNMPQKEDSQKQGPGRPQYMAELSREGKGTRYSGPWNSSMTAKYQADHFVGANKYGKRSAKISAVEGPRPRKAGGRTERSTGGDIALAAASPAGFAAKELGLKKGGRAARANGGSAKSLTPVNGPIKSIYGNPNVSRELNKPLSDKQVMADNLRHSRATPRDARASGGRTKGKTNINIVIAPGGGQPQPGGPPPMMPPIGAAPVAPPPEGALPPQAAPAPAAPPPVGMPRKDGGRTIKMEYGAGSGKGRLEKAGKY